MIIVYTGNGKGKTSACTGQAIRAIGQGLDVAFGQFMKKDKESGEQALLKTLLKGQFFNAGPGFLLSPADMPKQKEAAQKVLDWAKAIFNKVDMLILDEALYALQYGIIDSDDLKDMINFAKQPDKDLVLSGRGLPGWLLQEADLISEINEVKHPFSNGIGAKAGIDY